MVPKTQPAEGVALTPEKFAALPEQDGYRLELVRGSLVREPAPGLRHGRVAFRVVDLLRRFGEDNGLGFVFFDTGFELATEPVSVRVPDVAFVASGRVPEGCISDRFGEGAPDLAVEVVSPSNRASEIQRKALDYLDGGARLVWIVDPVEQTVTVYESRAAIRILVADDDLDGGDLLPDLHVPVRELFEPWSPPASTGPHQRGPR